MRSLSETDPVNQAVKLCFGSERRSFAWPWWPVWRRWKPSPSYLRVSSHYRIWGSPAAVKHSSRSQLIPADPIIKEQRINNSQTPGRFLWATNKAWQRGSVPALEGLDTDSDTHVHLGENLISPLMWDRQLRVTDGHSIFE